MAKMFGIRYEVMELSTPKAWANVCAIQEIQGDAFGAYVVARYGTNKATLKKIAKKLS